MPGRAVCALVALLLAGPAAPLAGASPVPDVKPSLAAENLADFDFVTRTIAANYAGWDTKVTPATRAALEALTAKLRAQAPTAPHLWVLLSEWLDFFHDNHLGVGLEARAKGQGGDFCPDGTREAARPTLPWTKASVQTRLTELGNRRDPLEGIWWPGGDKGGYHFGILRVDASGKRFAMVTVTADDAYRTVGQVELFIEREPDGALRLEYPVCGGVVKPDHAHLVADGGVLLWDDRRSALVREEPLVADADLRARVIGSSRMFLRPLSPETLWLRIPDFHDDRATPLKRLLAAHAAELAATPNLVIDLRHNGGGSDYVYEPLLPLIYTQPTYVIGMELRATRENIALRHADAEKIRAQAPDEADELEAENRLMARSLGGYVHPGPKGFGVDIQDAVLPSPKRVVVLIDGAGSTAEQFLLYARQSHKVTLMGERNSAGTLDFANQVSEPTPSGRFVLYWGISRSLRLPADPVDPDGIAPQIRIPADIADPVKFAQAWLERQVD